MSPDNVAIGSQINAQTPLPPAIKGWESYLIDQGRSIYTIKAFSGDLNLLASYLPPDRPIGSITTNDINSFLKWLQTGRGVPCSEKSLARRVTSIKSFFRWLAKYGAVSINPAEKVLQKTAISPLPAVLTTAEESRVTDTAQALRKALKSDARPLCLVTLLLETGIKKGECLALDLNHIDKESPDGAVLFIRYSNPRSRYKERKIALSSEWMQVLEEYLGQYQPKERLFPWSPRRLEYILEDLSVAAGIEKHLSFDMCRWTCAMNDWEAGIEPDKIRQKLGISKIQWREVSMKLRQLAAIDAPAES